jgi:hypothetical protein
VPITGELGERLTQLRFQTVTQIAENLRDYIEDERTAIVRRRLAG